MVFVDQSRTSKIFPSKILPLNFFLITRTAHTQCVVLLVSTTFSRSILCSVAMALYRYFQASEKSSCKLPDPCGPLSRLVPSSLIESANERVQSVLESKERTQSGRKGQHNSKQTEGRNRQTGSRARRGCYNQVIHYDCEVIVWPARLVGRWVVLTYN